ncbi:MAG: hypothetical protein IV097_08865 [Burkholderiaceae bacterium]|nr:hypothetical protein [Burkholderiaceae bacterium]
MAHEDHKRVPADFPRRGHPVAVSGFQPKLAVRLIDSKFVEGWTDEELDARFDACVDLVEQLTAYCHRKLAELPDASWSALLPRVRKGVEAKDWGLSADELEWIMKQVARRVTGHSEPQC